MKTFSFTSYLGSPNKLLSCCFLLLFMLFPMLSQAQNSVGACGVYHKPANESSIDQAVDLVDQFGNAYTFEELNIRNFRDSNDGESRDDCQGGDFTLQFSGFTHDEEHTICNVFQELSGILDIGPNGTSPLITVVKEPFINGDGTNNTTTPGVGTTFFQPDCGIANNLIFDVMYSGAAGNYAAGTAAGVLRINSLMLFYNDSQSPMANHFDLHTVALHEALHILGFSSQIASGGGTNQGFYSRWDTFLFSDDDNADLIIPGTPTPGCCDVAQFNPALNYSQLITEDCDMNIFFNDGQNIAEVFGFSGSAAAPGNLLSHLDRCGAGGDQYVMFAGINPMEERSITQEEIDILLALGYQADGGAEECNVIANNDYVVLTNQTFGSNIPYNLIFGNDAVPDDFDPLTDVIYHTSGCGTIDDFTNINLTPQATRLRIGISSCVTIDLCYTIIGCDGECADGVITIEKICPPCYPILPDCPAADMCAGDNLFCYGNFNQFIPKTTGNGPVFELDSPNCPTLGGSPDILHNVATGNRIVGMFASEGIIVPLSTPVPPGCTIDVSCRVSGSSPGTLLVYGSSMSPCESSETAACPSNNQSDFQCIGTSDFVDGDVLAGGNGSITCDATTPPDIDCTCTETFPSYEEPDVWSNVTLAPFVNNTDEPIEYLFIKTTAGYAFFDDLVVTANCDNEVTVTAETPVEVCQGQEASLAVTVCIEGTNTIPNDVIITANITDLIGLNIPTGSDFDGGSATIPNTIAGPVGSPNCYIVNFDLEVGFNIPVGTQIDVSFEANVPNACPDPNNVTDALINVIACDPDCVLELYPTITPSCGNDGAISIDVAGGSGNYTYTWLGASGSGNGSTITNLPPGDYTVFVVDATDPTCFASLPLTVPTDSDCCSLGAEVGVTASCGADGTITLGVSGGSGSYIYYWSGGLPNSPVQTGLAPGTYQVIIKDLINELCEPLELTIVVPLGTDCCSLGAEVGVTASCGADGAITLGVSGGSGSYIYYWSGGLPNSPVQTGLAPGTYQVIIKDLINELCEPLELTIVVPLGTDCNSSCDGTIGFEVNVEVDNYYCLEAIPGYSRHYIDMHVPNWSGTQNEDFELCSEDFFVLTPGVIIESAVIEIGSAFDVYTIIQVPDGTDLSNICFEFPVCLENDVVACAKFCIKVKDCPADECLLEIVPTIDLTPIAGPCNGLSGSDIFTANVSLEIENAAGYNIDYVRYFQGTGDAEPGFWQENNVPVIGGVGIVPDQELCWKSYENRYFCFSVKIKFNDGANRFVCKETICLLVDDLDGLNGDGGGGDGNPGLDGGGRYTGKPDKEVNNARYNEPLFDVFPNPVSQELSVENRQHSIVNLQLMTLEGKQLSQQALSAYETTKMNVGHFAPGIYILSIRDAVTGAILQTDKVIIAR